MTTLLQKLEDLVESDSFTTTVRVLREHAHKFKPQTSDEEHPPTIRSSAKYEKPVEAALEAFLKEQSSPVGALVGCVKRAQERGEPLACIDHLLATSDYPAFLELMLDYKFDMYAMEEITPGDYDEYVAAKHAGRAGARDRSGGGC